MRMSQDQERLADQQWARSWQRSRSCPKRSSRTSEPPASTSHFVAARPCSRGRFETCVERRRIRCPSRSRAPSRGPHRRSDGTGTASAACDLVSHLEDVGDIGELIHCSWRPNEVADELIGRVALITGGSRNIGRRSRCASPTPGAGGTQLQQRRRERRETVRLISERGAPRRPTRPRSRIRRRRGCSTRKSRRLRTVTCSSTRRRFGRDSPREVTADAFDAVFALNVRADSCSPRRWPGHA